MRDFLGDPRIEKGVKREKSGEPVYIKADFFSLCVESGPEVIKLFSCSTQLSMKFSPLINVKMPTIVGILTCMSGKNNILGLTEP